MRKGICYVVGAGDVCPRGLKPAKGDLLIAADGGLNALKRLKLQPRVVVGDMDSLRAPVRGIPVLRYPTRKDDTDLGLAIKLGQRLGFRRFRLYGAAGGAREDHFVAALQLMAGASMRGLDVQLVAHRFTVHAVTNGLLLLHTRPGATVSVFSASGRSSGVLLKGLSYQAHGLRLHSHRPLGVSNQTTGRSAAIGVARGTLLVWLSL